MSSSNNDSMGTQSSSSAASSTYPGRIQISRRRLLRRRNAMSGTDITESMKNTKMQRYNAESSTANSVLRMFQSSASHMLHGH